MKTPRYHAAYAILDNGIIDLALCQNRTDAEITLGQHKISCRSTVGITNRPATRHKIVKTLRDSRPGCTITVRIVR